MEKVYSPEVLALVEVLRANPGKTYTFNDLANEAGVPAKTGYLAGVKAILGKDNIEIGSTEVEYVATKDVKTYTFRG